MGIIRGPHVISLFSWQVRMAEDAYRILVCGLPDECRAIASVARQGADHYALTLLSIRQSPVDLIRHAIETTAPIEAAIVTAAWLQTEASLLLQPLLGADPRIQVILQASQSREPADRPAPDRVM